MCSPSIYHIYFIYCPRGPNHFFFSFYKSFTDLPDTDTFSDNNSMKILIFPVSKTQFHNVYETCIVLLWNNKNRMKWVVLFLSTFNYNIWYVHFLQQLQKHIYQHSLSIFPENFNKTKVIPCLRMITQVIWLILWRNIICATLTVR